MKILLTGGAGFIGSHVADLYIQNGHDVIIIDDLSSGKKENINSKAKFYQLDIRDQKIGDVISDEKPEIINHHAAHIHVGKSVTDPQNDADINILGFLNLMQAALKAGSVKKVIFASTGGAMYGNKKTPFVETMVPQPLSPYGISKRAGELYLNFYYQQYGINYIALRYSNVYGPRQNPHGEAGVVAIFAESLLKNQNPTINGDGKQTRDYVFVSDIAQANLLALDSNQVGEFNAGIGIETDVNQIFQLVQKEIGTNFSPKHDVPRPGEQQTSNLDASLANKKLNWQPKVQLKDGIKQTIDFFKNKSKS